MLTECPKRWQYSLHLYGPSAIKKDLQQPKRALKPETLYFCFCYLVNINNILETVISQSANISWHSFCPHETIVDNSSAGTGVSSCRILLEGSEHKPRGSYQNSYGLLLFLWISYYLNIDSAYVKFVRHYLNISHRLHVTNCRHTENISFIMCKCVYDLSPYLMPCV
jgi:hypothetical protein